MSTNPSPDFCTPTSRDDIEVLAGLFARVPNVPPTQPAFRSDVQEVTKLRASDLRACARCCVAKMTEYDLLWLAAEHDDLQALGRLVKMQVTQEQVRLAAKWFGGVYHEVRAAMNFEPL